MSRKWDATPVHIRSAESGVLGSGSGNALITVPSTSRAVDSGGNPITVQKARGLYSSAGNNTVIAAPAAGNRLVIKRYKAQNHASTSQTAVFKNGAGDANGEYLHMPNEGDGCLTDYHNGYEWRLSDATAFVMNLSAATDTGIDADYWIEATP